jgi:hypothetical protein
MPLYPIHSMGIKAWCSDLIIDALDKETVYFMSVCGYQVTVKGIIANLLENSGIEIRVDNNNYYLTRSCFKFSVLTRKLPSGLLHAIVIPKLALPNTEEEKENQFIVITKEYQDIRTLFFRHLDEKTEIPLHPSWASWLWKTFERQDDWVIELSTLVGDYKAYMFYFNPTELHDLIAKAIKKRVPDVVQCMTWKGDTNGTINPS